MAITVSQDDIDTFAQDGVVVIRKAISQGWVERMLQAADQQMTTPSHWRNDQPEASGGRMFTDRYLWPEHDEFRAFAMESGVAGLVGQLMQSQEARLYFDHLLIKEPNTNAATPWHQDLPYWPISGYKIASAWVALTDATIQSSAMEFVRGSHLGDTLYAPEVFGHTQNNKSASWQKRSNYAPVPDIENHRAEHDIISWDMQAGDAVVFSARVLHGAPGNASVDQRRIALSTRWLGDDAVWAPTPGTDPTVTQEHVSVQPGELAHDDERFPVAWRL